MGDSLLKVRASRPGRAGSPVGAAPIADARVRLVSDFGRVNCPSSAGLLATRWLGGTRSLTWREMAYVPVAGVATPLRHAPNLSISLGLRLDATFAQ